MSEQTDHVPGVEVLDNRVLGEPPERFWAAVRHVPSYLHLAANLARDSNVPKSAKFALAIGGIYTISPVDLVPGIIPVAGQLDDLAVLLFAIRTAVRACSPETATIHLERVGLSRLDVEDDVDATKAMVRWLAEKGAGGARTLFERGMSESRMLAAQGRRVVGGWVDGMRRQGWVD